MLAKAHLFARNKSSFGLLTLVLILGGISAQASGLLNTAPGGYLVCVEAKTNEVMHPGTDSCPKGAKRLILGAQGAAGVAGAAGLAGASGLPGKDGANDKDGKTLWNGLKDPESTWGAPGDMFINSITKTLFGPKSIDGLWPAGVSMVGANGAAGPAGAKGADGPTGPQGPGGSGPAGATGPAGSNGSNGFVSQSICGAGGTTLCTIGAQGPGGGLIFFVDYNNQYAGFNYLEAAPYSCEAQKNWSSDQVNSLAAVNGWAARAVGSGQANTTAMLSSSGSYVADTSGAAFYADGLNCGTKSDWFLGSLGEMKLMYDNLQGLGGFKAAYPGNYWSSSGYDLTYAWAQDFPYGGPGEADKYNPAFYVRPVRAF